MSADNKQSVSDVTAMVAQAAPSVMTRLGNKYGVDPSKMMDTLQKTCFKPAKDGKQVTTEQMMMLMVVADQYGLNPFLREIYAFPTNDGGIQPIIGVDGWVRMMNEHPQFNGVEFVYGPIIVPKNDNGVDSPIVVNEWIECVIHRKDREHAIRVPEYIVECRRNSDPWKNMPRRMLRHKALIQCIRYAFGFAGMDEDDYERMNSAPATPEGPAPMVRGRHHLPKASPPAAAEVTEITAAPEPDETGAIDAQATVKTETVTDEGEVIEDENAEAEILRDEAISHIEQSLKEDMTPARVKSLQEHIDKCRALIGDAYHQNFSDRLSKKLPQSQPKKRNLF